MTVSYLVAGTKPWNRRIFDEVLASRPGHWHFVDRPEDLTPEKVTGLAPRYLFFLHWSWKVPAEIYEGHECVCFHMTDLPYGRGGSPLQNLIVRGHRRTRLTAFRMVAELDAGPVYLERALCLEGTAEEILMRACALSAEMVLEILRDSPVPRPQEGEPVVFKRRGPGASRIPELADLPALHDYIRMLDAEGYPPAFLEHGGFRYELRRAALYDGRVEADVRITPLKKA